MTGRKRETDTRRERLRGKTERDKGIQKERERQIEKVKNI